MQTLISQPTKQTIVQQSRYLKRHSNIREKERGMLFNPVAIIDAKKVFGFDTLRHLTNMVFVTKPDGERMLVNTCSNGYSLIPLQNWLPQFEDYLDKKFDFEVRYFHRNYAYFRIEYKIKNMPVHIGNNNDILYPQITLQYSYDSSSMCKVSVGVFRLVCTNGLVVPAKEGSADSLRKKHFGTFDTQALLDYMVQGVDFIADMFPSIVKQYEVLGDRVIEKWEDRLEEIALGVNYPVSLIETAINRHQFELDMYLDQPTEWSIYNALNFPLSNNWDTLKMQPEKRHQLDQRLINFISN